jgi:hypothetical protein
LIEGDSLAGIVKALLRNREVFHIFQAGKDGLAQEHISRFACPVSASVDLLCEFFGNFNGRHAHAPDF